MTLSIVKHHVWSGSGEVSSGMEFVLSPVVSLSLFLALDFMFFLFRLCLFFYLVFRELPTRWLLVFKTNAIAKMRRVYENTKLLVDYKTPSSSTIEADPVIEETSEPRGESSLYFIRFIFNYMWVANWSSDYESRYFAYCACARHAHRSLLFIAIRSFRCACAGFHISVWVLG
jgi:hypothetical protein